MYNKVSNGTQLCGGKIDMTSYVSKAHHDAFGWLVGWVIRQGMYFIFQYFGLMFEFVWAQELIPI
jgi:hypothetical protein